MEKVIVVVGPTGVGKTKLGVELAKMLNTEIISGDSMQIYRGMDIGTAKVTEEEAQGIVHHQIDIKDVDESFSVFDFQQNTRSLISKLNGEDKIPIIVGGTGFYIKATLYDYNFDQEERAREEIVEEFNDYSNDDLHEYLRSIDPEGSKKIHINNRKRVLRAIEYYKKHNKPMSDNVKSQSHEVIYDAYIIGLTLERDKLYNRINERVDKMIEEGLIEEVKSFYDKGYSPNLQSMQGIGYKELFTYFNNQNTLEYSVNKIKQYSRNYAKKQYTWFNNQMNVNWYEVNLDDFDETVNRIKKDVNKFLK